jgi:hypothetical protein
LNYLFLQQYNNKANTFQFQFDPKPVGSKSIGIFCPQSRVEKLATVATKICLVFINFNFNTKLVKFLDVGPDVIRESL